MIAYLRTNNDLSEKPPHTLCKNLYLTLHAMIYDPLSRRTAYRVLVIALAIDMERVTNDMRLCWNELCYDD